MRKRILLVAAALLGAWLVACAFLFVWPPADAAPAHTDAIVVLAGSRKQRLTKGLELVDRGVSRTLVISDGYDPDWPEANRLCDGADAGLQVICFRPEPYSTWGEAEGVARLVRTHGWDSVAVVTSTSHVFRARLIFERCLPPGLVDVVGAGHRLLYLPQQFFWESAKLVAAVTFKRGC